MSGRLQGQKQWYLSKARKYQLWYFLFLASIGLIYVFNFLWCTIAGKAFWVVAGTTAVNLMLFAILDFLNYGPLWYQYRQAARELEAIEKAFADRLKPFNVRDESN